MQRVDLKKINKIITSTNTEDKSESRLLMFFKNDSGEIVEGFQKQNEILADLTGALRKVSHYFDCIHVMTRAELCNGN